MSTTIQLSQVCQYPQNDTNLKCKPHEGGSAPLF
uniref:Uncharacterized protein n=1 Tax=Anguilla anguilla TaxID=7936 RepID=A0A0E9W7H7_ANGAN